MAKNGNIEELYQLYEDKLQSYLITDETTAIHNKIIYKPPRINEVLINDQKDLLQDILESEHERGALENQETFVYAFNLAIKLIFDGVINGL